VGSEEDGREEEMEKTVSETTERFILPDSIRAANSLEKRGGGRVKGRDVHERRREETDPAASAWREGTVELSMYRRRGMSN
jgi:hypothetical protein